MQRRGQLLSTIIRCDAILRMHGLRLILLILAGLLSNATAWAVSVQVVLSDDSPPYHEVANSFRAQLRQYRPTVNVVIEDSPRRAAYALAADTQLLVCVGLKATQAALALQAQVPILSVLVPKDSLDVLAPDNPVRRSITAIYLDQPYARQLALVRLALSEQVRVGVLLREEDQQKLDAIQVAARLQKMRVVSELIDNQVAILPSLEHVLAASDVLLVLPDALLYNKNNIQSVLLTSYRYRDPVVSYSQALVRAGAMLGLYSNPVQIGSHAAEVALHSLGTGVLPAPLYPKYFTVGVNRQVAHSLGLPAPDEIELQEALQRWEREQ